MQGSYYMLVKFFPDARLEEQIYIGAIAWDETDIRCYFVRDWRRVEQFARRDIAPIRETAREIEDFVRERGIEAIPKLQKCAGRWVHCVRITHPRYAHTSLDDIWAEVMSWLQVREPMHRAFRDRRAAAKLAYDNLYLALAERLGKRRTEELVKQREAIPGRFEEHTFDVVVKNGAPFMAAAALSFELPRGEALKQEVSALKWAIIDTLNAHPQLAMAVIVLPPKPDSPGLLQSLYQSTLYVLGKRFGLRIIDETHVMGWAKEVASKVAAQVAER